MALALASQFDQFRIRVRNSQLGHFFAWWAGELRDLLPETWRARLLHARQAVVLKLGESELAVAVLDGDSRHELGVFALSEDPRLHQQKLREMLLERELLEAPRELLLDEAEVLRKEVVLPLAAETGLAQALAYEMDRQTPFRAADVFYAYRILRRDRDASQLRVELLVTPRAILGEKLELLAPRGMAPTAVDVEIDGEPAGINLLPMDMRFRVADWRSRLNWALAGVFLLLLAGVMMQSLWLRQHQAESLETAIEDVRTEAMRVQQIRQQIEDAREAAGFLSSRRAASMPTVKVLAEVTRVLPDDTYLDRLMIGEGTVQMQGKSSNAQRLIELVNQSGYFSDAAFRGPTRLDSSTRKEIFDLTANITLKGGG
jgi:general secretion pathway protein L